MTTLEKTIVAVCLGLALLTIAVDYAVVVWSLTP